MGSGSSRGSDSVDNNHPRTRTPVPDVQPSKTVSHQPPDVDEKQDVSESNSNSDSELEDIQELEKTFDSLGIKDSVEVEEEVTDHEEPVIASDSEHNEDANLKSESTSSPNLEHTSLPHDSPLHALRNDSISARSSRVISSKNDIIITSSYSNVNNTTSSSSVHIPVEVTEPSDTSPEEQDDWVYSKKRIEGFDPEKFRKANRREISLPSDDNISLSFLRRESLATLHPLRLPSYDSSEEQILAGIEHEFMS